MIPAWPPWVLLELADHPVDGGLDLVIRQRRIAAAGRHHATIRAIEAVHRMAVERVLALRDARGPSGFLQLRRLGHAGGVAAGAQIAENHRTVERARVSD